MTPPTSKALEEAVERAARWFNVSQTEARGMLSAALPGLFNGTMWLAPWEATEEMRECAGDHPNLVWVHMRDAYLNAERKE